MKHIAEQFELFAGPLNVDGEKPKAFFFHYNKPASQKAGRPKISVHWSGSCLIADNIECRVTCRGRIRNKQPYFVMAGKGVVRWYAGANGRIYAVIL